MPMDKMTHAKFNLNNFTMGLSTALDQFFEPNKHKIEFSSQRVTYITLRLASYINFEEKYLADIAVYGLLYRFNLSETDLQKIPFLDLKHLDDTSKEIMQLSLSIEENLQIESNVVINIDAIRDIVNNMALSEAIKENFTDLSEDMIFWLELTDRLQLPTFIYNFLQDFTRELKYTQLIKLSELINKLIHNGVKSEIGIKAKKMCEYYNMDNKDSSRLILAVNLCAIGKLFVSKDIYTKNSALNKDEQVMVQSIPYFSFATLSLIYGFDDIAKLCSLFNEKLDGSGKPYEMDGSSLSLNNRLMAILVIYQALLEPRSYRKAYSHDEAVYILRQDAGNGKLDGTIVEDIDKVFKG